MKISIVSVGKIKEKFYTNAINEYAKRMSAYANMEFKVLKDEKAPATLSDKQMEQIKNIEGERILNAIDSSSYVIALDRVGKQLDSIQLAKHIEDLSIRGNSHICFIIGGSLGLSDAVIKRADFSLSFSKMTFPHQLMKVILIEQVYRAFKIIKGETYHK